jgi:glycerophosphoryl diester phosphodiesterase
MAGMRERHPRRPLRRRVLRGLTVLGVVAVAAYLVGWAASSPRPAHPYVALLGPGPHVHAHQGGNHLWPDNTLYAFRNAHELDVDVLELDVHRSADGAVVVIHDDTVDRTTDGSGRVDALTLAELQALDAAYRWRPPGGDLDAFPYRGQGIAIPTLDEVFAAFPGRPINVELKADDDALIAATCELIRAHGREHATLVASFHQRAIDVFRARCPEVATSAGTDEATRFVVMNMLFLGRLYTPQAEAFQLPVRRSGIEVVTPRLVRGLRERNVLLDVWTINDEAEMRRLFDMGVGALITDRPDLALALLGR